jgi:Rha family phage regulatory protein
MENAIALPEDAVMQHDGRIVTTSLKIAEAFGKQHQHVLRTIKDLDCPEEFAASNFGLCSYVDGNNRQRPMYDMTKDGAMVLIMGFTGPLAMQIKIAYIEMFNRMESALRHAVPTIPQGHTAISAERYIELLECENQTLKGVERRAKIPAELKGQIVQHHLAGLKPARISEITGVKKGTVETQIYKFKKGELL